MNNEKRTWVCLDEVGSTNELAKEKRGENIDYIFLAKRQTGGRGTKGRSFSSEEGGVYLTALTHPENFPASRAFEVMAGAAVAVCKTLKYYGLEPKIKWPNDILVRGKKICGILIENILSGGQIACSIVGIGVNVSNPLPKELESIATSVLLAGGRVAPVEEVARRLVAELARPTSMSEYRRYLGLMGKRVTLVVGEKRVPVTLLSVTDEGGLCVEIEGEKQVLSSAEVEYGSFDE